jgi:hypothetical protein
MSSAYYSTRLFYIEGRIGIAKLRGVGRKIVLPPKIAGLEAVEVDYTPEVRVHLIREKHQGWREMERHEIQACDAYLNELFARPPGEPA